MTIKINTELKRLIQLSLITCLVVLLSCEGAKGNAQTEKSVAEITPITAELAIRCARVSILNQLPDPANTTFGTDSTRQLNDTSFRVFGDFNTISKFGGREIVKFDCVIDLSRDGQDFALSEINTY